MRKEHTISAHIDRWEKSSTEISVTGWAYSVTGNCEIHVLDGNQREIPAIVRRSRRIDIDRLFSITERQDTGFNLYVQRGEVTGKKMYVIFADANEQQLFQINLLKEQGAAVRTLPFADWFKPATWAKGFRYVFNNGGLKALRRDQQAPSEQVLYDAWFKKQRVTEEQLAAQRGTAAAFANRPKISIAIPLFNTNLKYLDVLLDSIEGQSYENWELCLADGSTEGAVEMHLKARYQPDFSRDSRIRYQRLKENAGIAGNTNAALGMASGDYIMLSDHDDVIEKDALFEIVKLLNADPSLDIVYTDEDLTDEAGEHFRSPRFKPDFNIDLLRSINYICHLFCIRTSVMHKIGGFRSDCDGAQDWDLFLRCSEQTKRIGHVPKILYHWRESESSTARNPESKTYAIESARKALEGHYRRCGLAAELHYTDIFIMYQAKLLVHDNPKVSILIPNKDNRDVLKTCIDSIMEKSTYRNLEILVIENNSTEEETFRYYEELTDGKNAEKAGSGTASSDLTEPVIRVLYYKDKFNYAKINNFGAQYATGDYLLLLNNDTEVITPDWIEQMLGYCQREDVGAAGAKLLYPDETVQHCGVVVGVGGFAGHVLTGKLREDAGYMGRLRAIYDVSAVTGACLMIKRSIFEEIGGLDENLTVALNDIDLCLKVRETGALIVQNPAAELFHYESKSRGYEETPEKHERFKKEIKYFRDKWKDVIDAGDPYYNPNLSLMYGDCRLREKDEHFDIVDEIEEERSLRRPGQSVDIAERHRWRRYVCCAARVRTKSAIEDPSVHSKRKRKMKKKNEHKLSQVQSIIWDIMKEIKPYLEEQGIPYFMLGGTLLGAVRHQGFIPWDDDIDIGIPRRYYEYFLRNVSRHLPEHLKLRTFRDGSGHHYYFARIVDTRYKMRRTGSEIARDEEVWIDIFPLDGMPRTPLIRRIHMFRLLAVRALYHIACFDKVNLKRPGRPLSERMIIKFVQLTGFGRTLDIRKRLEKLDRLLKKFPYEKSPFIVNCMGQYKFKEMFPRGYYGKGRQYPFEDTTLPGPVMADKVLRQMYGDYMKEPENKNAHAAVFVETG